MMIPLFVTLLVALALAGLAAILVVRYRRTGARMKLREALRRLVRARGVGTITARRLHEQLAAGQVSLLVDLREPRNATEPFHERALHVPFDEFLRQAVVEERFAEHRDRPVVLVCDHGNLSRIAGDVLAEDLGFGEVHSLRGGTWAWQRHERALQQGRCCAGARAFLSRPLGG